MRHLRFCQWHQAEDNDFDRQIEARREQAIDERLESDGSTRPSQCPSYRIGSERENPALA